MQTAMWRYGHAETAGMAVPASALTAGALLLCLLLPGICRGQEPALSTRQPLIDALAREEVDSYDRLDDAMARAAALPHVFDPAIYAAETTTAEIRGQIQGYLLWLHSAESSHLEKIESLPARLARIGTREPYRSELIDTYRDSTAERYRRISRFYQGEIAAAKLRLAFLDFLDQHDIRPQPDGFRFASEADIQEYHRLVDEMNDISAAQDLRVSEYYAWEIRQKALLRQFRDQL
jgi:hypothetical protein